MSQHAAGVAVSHEVKYFPARAFQCIANDDGDLGEGAFGKVRFAFHDHLGSVALKCFDVTGGQKHKDILSRVFKNEVKALQLAQSIPHILLLYGWTQWGRSVAIVMEYMPGGNLSNLIFDKTIELAMVLRLRLCFDVSDGIAFMHNIADDQCLKHGDLKPSNVLLDAELHAKICDFGGAKFGKQTGSRSSTTCSTSAKRHFTKAYSAPEFLKKPFTHLSKEQDTYSFGMIVNCVLCRKRPDEDYSKSDAFRKSIMAEFRPNTQVIEDLKHNQTSTENKITEALESEMTKCWSGKARKRPLMKDVRDRLAELLQQQNETEIKKSVAATISRMKLFQPSNSDYDCVTLNLFDV